MQNYEPPTVTPIGKVEDLTKLIVIIKDRVAHDRYGQKRRLVYRHSS